MTLDTSVWLAALGWGVLQFLWQGVVIGGVAWVALLSLRRASPDVRCGVSLAAMLACAVVFVATVALAGARAGGVYPVGALPTMEPRTAMGRVGDGAEAGGSVLAWIAAWAWIVGVALMGARFAWQWGCARRLACRGVSAPEEAWRLVFDGLKRRLGVRAGVRLLRSERAEAPMVVGWLAPVVLAPVSAFTSLSPEQLRAVLAHELSHIRRHDHWVNAAQGAVETVLFFHPVVWWLSSRARLEREHCCDDVAVRSARSPRVLAEALARLEAHRQTHASAAVAANGGPLMERIARILGTTPPASARSSAWRTLSALFVGAGVAAAGLAHAASAGARPDQEQTVSMLRHAYDSGASPEQVRELYDALVYQGSETQRKIAVELEAIEADVRAAVNAGRLTQEEAERKLGEIRRHFGAQRELAFAVEVLGQTREEAHLSLLRSHLEELVRRGDLTKEEAAAKIDEMRHGLDQQRVDRRRLNEIHEQFDMAVAVGKLTREEARAKLSEIERENRARVQLRALETKLEHLVQLGELTRAEADQKIASHLERLTALREVAELDRAAMREHLERAVVEGKLTDEQARRHFDAERVHEAARASLHRMHDHLHALHHHLRRAANRGEITREQAELKERKLQAELEALQAQIQKEKDAADAARAAQNDL